jgi:predicted ATPase/DNA-binding CsgD family transcriptional regulator
VRELLARNLSPLVGRESELRALRAALSESQIVTVTGPGGVGKTRLALASIGDADPPPLNVELGAIREPGLVVSAVMEAASVRPESGVAPLSTLVAALAQQRRVLLLDNCEHLRDGVAQLCAELLHALPELRILLTSRVILGVPGETGFELAPLSLGKEGDAVALFIDRARRASRSFEADADTVATLSAALDGLPLAIELAAARTKLFDVERIAADLARRLDLLAGGPEDQPRHRSLRASIEWSYELLSAQERALFGRLAVFAGGARLEAAEAVCAEPPVARSDVLDLLGALVDQSLLTVDRSATDTRFGMLATVRAFALERLDGSKDGDRTRAAHAAWCAEFMRAAELELTRGEQSSTLRELDAETDNVRAALDWADPAQSIRIAPACALHWHARGRFAEGRRRLEPLTQPAHAEPAAVRAHLNWALGLVLVGAGDLAAAESVVDEAVGWARDAGDPALQARALNLAGELRLMSDPVTAAQPLQEAAALSRLAGDRVCLAEALGKLGAQALYRSDAAAARANFEECLELARASNDERTVHRALGGIARVTAIEGDVENALTLLHQGLEISLRLADRSWIAVDLAMLGELERAAGRPADGRQNANKGLALAEEIGAAYPTYLATGVLGRIALALGEIDLAAACFARAVELGEQRRLMPFSPWWRLGLAEVAASRNDLETTAVEARAALACAEALGNARDATRAMALLGSVELRRSEPELAIRHLTTALATQRELHDVPGARVTLARLTEALTAAGQAELAERINSALMREHSGFDDAIALAVRGRGPRQRERAGGWGGLTRAEAEVAELAASGLTNSQIGEQLFMSRTTVKRHLSRVFAQLGVANRTELARALQTLRGSA